MSKPPLILTGSMLPLIDKGIEADFEVHLLPRRVEDRAAFLAKVGPSIEAICTGAMTGVKTTSDLISHCPKLRIIANFGVGYDSVDVAAAAKVGAIVTNTPDVLTERWLTRRSACSSARCASSGKAENWLRDGSWGKKGDYRLTPGSLRGRSVGIAGLGRIGKAIAKRCEAFGLPVSYYGRSKQADVSYPTTPTS